MLKIGLTGNIGSGKTLIAKIFSTFGAAVFNSDDEAKLIMKEERVQKLLIERFGIHILNEENIIDRKLLAQLLFNDKDALNFANNLIHPLVRQNFKDFCIKHANSPCCIYEAAIIIETGYYKNLDRVILVTAPEKLRIQRIVDRDKINEALVKQRMENQWSEDEKIPFADFIIVNDGSKPLVKQCVDVFNKICAE